MMKYFTIITLFAFSLSISFAQTKDCPCCTENHKAFDFWLGSWEVTNPDGTKAGNNTITKIQNNCVIKEEWTSAKQGYTGTSYNFYNSKTKQWEQLWIDNQGQSLKLKGTKTKNQMILFTQGVENNGNFTYNKVTWTANKNGTVHQLWEKITNKKSKVIFDCLYQLVKK